MSFVASVALINQPATTHEPSIGTELFSRISSVVASIFNFISNFFSSLITQTRDTPLANQEAYNRLANTQKKPTGHDICGSSRTNTCG